MWTYAVLATALLSCIDAGDDIYVTSSSCGRDTSFPWTNEATLKYSGGFLSSKACTFSFEKDDSDWDKEICVEAEEFSLPCGVKVKYNGGYYPTYQGYHTAEKEFTCDNTQVFRWCSSAGKVYIGFEDTERGQIGSVELKITVKSNSDAAEFVASAVTSVAVIIGVVFGLIVLVVIVVIVIVCCVCNKRRSTGGTVYRAPQQAVATTGQSYPANANYPQQQAGYQPPPQGYQPQGYQPQGNQPPQQGYQPPPQGYQPPPQGYQQPPAQGYAVGYQAYPPEAYGAGYQPPPGYPGNPSVMTEKPVASAPPADMAPPPYPGN